MFKLLNVFVQIGKCFLFKLLNVFVQISTFSPQPLPLLLLFLFQFLSWKSADLEFLKELSGLNSFQPYLANKKKGGGEEVGKCFKATFAFKIYAKTILSRKSKFLNYLCVFRKFLFLSTRFVHLLLSSSPSQLRLQNNVSGSLLKRRQFVFLLKLNSNRFNQNRMADF